MLRDVLGAELRRLGADDVEFVDPPFRWSGCNSHEDRRAASIRLCEQLKKRQAQPHAPVQLVIAHSHGGNIALRALALSPDVGQKTLVVTLATPFLRFERQRAGLLLLPLIVRQLAVDLKTPWSRLIEPIRGLMTDAKRAPWRRLLILAAIAGVVVTGFLLTALLLHSFVLAPIQRSLAKGLEMACSALPAFLGVHNCARAPFWWWVTPPLSLVVFGGLVQLVEARKRVIKDQAAELDSKRDAVIRRYSYFQPAGPFGSVRLLVMSSVVDEAMAILTGAWWAHRASVLGARVVGAASLSVAFGLVAVVVYAIVLLVSADLGGFSASLAAACALLLAIVCLGLVASMAQIASRVATSLGRLTGLWLADPEGGLLTRVTASRRPGEEIAHEYRRYGICDLLRGSSGLLFHSRLYSHPQAIRDIAAWVMDNASVRVPARMPQATGNRRAKGTGRPRADSR